LPQPQDGTELTTISFAQPFSWEISIGDAAKEIAQEVAVRVRTHPYDAENVRTAHLASLRDKLYQNSSQPLSDAQNKVLAQEIRNNFSDSEIPNIKRERKAQIWDGLLHVGSSGFFLVDGSVRWGNALHNHPETAGAIQHFSANWTSVCEIVFGLLETPMVWLHGKGAYRSHIASRALEALSQELDRAIANLPRQPGSSEVSTVQLEDRILKKERTDLFAEQVSDVRNQMRAKVGERLERTVTEVKKERSSLIRYGTGSALLASIRGADATLRIYATAKSLPIAAYAQGPATYAWAAGELLMSLLAGSDTLRSAIQAQSLRRVPKTLEVVQAGLRDGEANA
jgi:hypothetical protein